MRQSAPKVIQGTLGVMSVDAELRGDGCTLVLRVAGYEARDIRSGEDANWLTAEVELTVGLYGSYGLGSVALCTPLIWPRSRANFECSTPISPGKPS
jgi:hypothetical protein